VERKRAPIWGPDTSEDRQQLEAFVYFIRMCASCRAYVEKQQRKAQARAEWNEQPASLISWYVSTFITNLPPSTCRAYVEKQQRKAQARVEWNERRAEVGMYDNLVVSISSFLSSSSLCGHIQSPATSNGLAAVSPGGHVRQARSEPFIHFSVTSKTSVTFSNLPATSSSRHVRVLRGDELF